MQTWIRDSVFETNSSSSHSVTVADSDMPGLTFDPAMLEAGVITATANPNGYGWQWERYYKPENKLAYLISQVANHELDDLPVNQPVFRRLAASYPELAELGRLIREQTGCDLEFVVPNDNIYIDHESYGVGRDIVSHPAALMTFLLSRGSYIELGNDNSGPGEKMKTDIGEEEAYPGIVKAEPVKECWIEMSVEPEADGRSWNERSIAYTDSDGRMLEHKNHAYGALEIFPEHAEAQVISVELTTQKLGRGQYPDHLFKLLNPDHEGHDDHQRARDALVRTVNGLRPRMEYDGGTNVTVASDLDLKVFYDGTDIQPRLTTLEDATSYKVRFSVTREVMDATYAEHQDHIAAIAERKSRKTS